MQRRCLWAAAVLLPLLLLPMLASAQNDGETYEQFKKRMQQEYGNFKQQQKKDYEDFRKKANEDYANFVEKYWEELAAFKGQEPKIPKPLPPVVCPEEDRKKAREDEKKPFEDLVVVEPPKPQPEPVVPIGPQPVDTTSPKPRPNETPKPQPLHDPKPKKETISILFFGTAMQCQVNTMPRFTLDNLNEKNVSDAWLELSSGQCDSMLRQCLELRKRYRLNDWAYIQMLDSFAQKCCSQPNKATLLMAWLYCQSGYKMRLGRTEGKLYMLFASENQIYHWNYFTVNNEKFYPYKGQKLERIFFCNAIFPKEQTMTLKMIAEPSLTYSPSSRRTLQSERYAQMRTTNTVNRNLIDFYNGYPTGSINKDFSTRWAMYANTPLSNNAQESLYPQLREIIKGKSKLQAAEELLNFVQTAFVYEYDDTVWGYDRAFFAEETLFYPYADCEDRSILFSRIVRDLLGLRTVLLFYPGHLATAVRFEGQHPNGDYIHLPDGDYYVADPTYIGAPIGLTMPSCKNAKITVVLLEH